MAIRLLIVEDHPVVVQGLEAFLALYDDVEVVGTAGSAPDAVARARAAHPDVVLLDLQLAGSHGLEAIPKLRALPAPPAVVVLTSFLDDEFVREAVALGATGYLIKSVGPDRILEAVRAAARGEMALDPGAVRALSVRERDPLGTLTPRELDVLSCLGEGLTNRAIARRLGVTEKTVKSHVSAVLAKLGVSSRTQAALYAARSRRPT